MLPFSAALSRRKNAGFVPVIPDFKRISPAEGELFAGRNPVEMAKILVDIGAPVLSVVTERFSFGGSRELLEEIAEAARIPILRKDFIRTTADIRDTKAMGAAAVLLICASYTEETLQTLYHAALAEGLEPLVETQNSDELRWARDLGAKLVGINNRDILNMERDGGTVARTTLLAGQAPQEALLVSESGLQTRSDVEAALICGADAVLVGTALWRAPDMNRFYSALSAPFKGDAK